MYLFFIWLIIYIFLLVNYNNKTIFFLPVVVVLTQLSFQLISFSEYSSAVILTSYSIIFFSITVSLIEIININKLSARRLSVFKRIILFISLLFILAFFNSSEVWLSIKRILSIVASLLVFLALYQKTVDSFGFFRGLNSIVLYIFLFSANFLFLSIFRIGPSLNEFSYMEGYSESFLRTGSFGFFELHGVIILSALVLIFSKLLNTTTFRYLGIGSSLVIFTMIIFTYKRAFLLTFLSGIIIYYLIYILKAKHKVLNLAGAVVALGIFLVLSFSQLENFVITREIAYSTDYFKNEGRLLEFLLYPKTVSEQNHPVLFMLFGSETFISGGKYNALNVGIEQGRFLHNDFAHLLYGTGIVGTLLYLSILYFILNKSLMLLKYNSSVIKYIGTGSLILVVAIIISGLSDGILSFQNRIIPFFAIGLFLGYARSLFNQNQATSKI